MGNLVNKYYLLVILAMIELSCSHHKAGDRFISCKCLSGYYITSFVFVNKIMIPINTWRCTAQECDSVVMNKQGQLIIIKK